MAENDTSEIFMVEGAYIDEYVKRSLKQKYFSKHPFMKLFYAGKLTPEQIRGWIINRYYYQKQIPLKDSIILAKCTEPAARRIWLQRLMKREGIGGYKGDVEGWVSLAEAAGIPRKILETSGALPGVKMAVDAYLNFVKTVSWVEGVATSLSELLAVDELPKRIEALRRHYGWIEEEGIEFFIERLSYIKEDTGLVLELLSPYIKNKLMMKKCLDAARFNCDVHWTVLDAIYMEYVLPTKLSRVKNF